MVFVMGQAVERGSFMIEIIREESWDSEQEKKELPKNIKQIGSPDIGDRIYIENKAYEYMHPYDALLEKTVYVLLGRFENNLGRQCVFVEAAICLEEIAFEGDCPVWSDESWAYLYKKLKHAYDEMVIVGWAMDIRGQLPNLTVAIEKLHRTYFGGEHQILYLMDSLEKEDAFYSLKNGYLKRRAGYYVYYGQKSLENAAIENIKRRKEPIIEEENIKPQTDRETWSESFFSNIQTNDSYEQEEQKEKARMSAYRSYLQKAEQKTKMLPSYGMSFFLLLVVCGLGIAAFKNHQKMDAMETALKQMNREKTMATEAQSEEPEENDAVKVESVEGNIFPQADAQQVETETEDPLTPEQADNHAPQSEDTEQQTENTAPQAENTAQQAEENTTLENADAQPVQSYLSQGYYIVQKGDSRVGICKKIYHTTAVMDQLCKVNGIENPDAIYEGQCLSLPN